LTIRRKRKHRKTASRSENNNDVLNIAVKSNIRSRGNASASAQQDGGGVQAESAGPAKPCVENEGLDGGGARRPG